MAILYIPEVVKIVTVEGRIKISMVVILISSPVELGSVSSLPMNFLYFLLIYQSTFIEEKNIKIKRKIALV